jgi:hypothetical protein
MFIRKLTAYCFLSSLTIIGRAQTIDVCPYSPRHRTDLACLIPNLTQTGSSSNLSRLNTSLAQVIAQLPLPSPVSGFVLVYDKSGNPSERSDNLGSILTERGNTIGRHKFFAAFTFQRFVFQTIDDIKLSDLPSVYQLPTQPGSQPDEVIEEFGAAKNVVALNINQYTGIVAFGLTTRFDVAVTIPVERVSLAAGNDNLQTASYPRFFVLGGAGIGPSVADTPSSTSHVVAGSATGLGDLLVNVKGSVINGEKSKLAGGVEVRFPTGDQYKLLGTGAYGAKPYIVYSRYGRVTPHVNIGYQWNGPSALYINLCFFRLTSDPTNCLQRSSLPTTKLPGSVNYAAGVDVGIVKQVTAIADFVGYYYINDPRVTKPVTAAQAGIPSIPINNLSNSAEVAHFNNSPTIGISTQNTAVDDLALGIKWNPAGRLIISGNALVRLDNGGLRQSRVVPLVGVSYRF